jgi:hypothetical protein
MTSSEEAPSQEIEQLNCSLLRVLLRSPLLYSPLFLDEEERLVNTLVAVLSRLLDHPWIHRRHDTDAVAKSVCFDLMFAWRGAMPLWFTRTYLWALLRRRLGEERPTRGEAILDLETVAARQRDEAILAEEVDQLRRVGAAFRSGLNDAHRALFDAWIRDAGEPGWKKAFADATHRSPTWVTNHLNRLREELRSSHRVTDPDQFIQALQFFTPPSGDDLPEAESADEQPENEFRELAPRVELREVFGDDLLLQRFRQACADPAGLSDQEVLAEMIAENDAGLSFDGLLRRACDCYIRWVRDVGRQRLAAWRYYRRLTSGRVNIETILALDHDGWTAPQIQLARRLAAAARPQAHRGEGMHQPSFALSFEELPQRLGMDRRAIDELLLRLRDCAARRDVRARDTADRPHAGG